MINRTQQSTYARSIHELCMTTGICSKKCAKLCNKLPINFYNFSMTVVCNVLANFHVSESFSSSQQGGTICHQNESQHQLLEKAQQAKTVGGGRQRGMRVVNNGCSNLQRYDIFLGLFEEIFRGTLNALENLT